MQNRRYRTPPKLAAARRAGYAAWRKADESARLDIPPEPPDPLPGDELQRWEFVGPGWSVDVSLQYISRRARSDHVIPRTATRRQRDEVRPVNGHISQDDIGNCIAL